MPNAYISLSAFKATAAIDVQGTQYDTRLLQLIENISRAEDRYCDRYFYVTVEVRKFSGFGSNFLIVPDLIALPASAILGDDNKDGTYEVTWGSNDYLLAPYNANPTATFGNQRPYYRIEVNLSSNGTQTAFLSGQNNYSITGTWGFSYVRANIAGALSASIDATGTALTLTTAGTISVGETIIIDNEQLYISSTGTGSNLTVQRGVNGSPGATHTSTATVQIVVYPGPVQEAALIQTARLWQRRYSAFANQIGMPETGQFVQFTGGLDGDVKMLINQFVRYGAG